MPQDTSDAEAKLVPDETGAAYEQDFYTWTFEQARLIRAGRFGAVDRENVAEEIESLGREQFSKLRSTLRVLLAHMLKWDHQAERRGCSWAVTITTQRGELEEVLDGNPGLKPRISEAISKAYRLARREAAVETGLDLRRFPEQCPYNWDEITERDFAA